MDIQRQGSVCLTLYLLKPICTSKGRRRYWVCKRRLCLRTLYGGEQELTVVFSKTSRGATKAVYLVTDHTWSARRVVRTYALRWTIETGHKQQYPRQLGRRKC